MLRSGLAIGCGTYGIWSPSATLVKARRPLNVTFGSAGILHPDASVTRLFGDPDSARDHTAGRTRLLLVGGTADEVDLYETGLTLYGFEVRTLREVIALRAAIEESRPDAVILNLELESHEVWRELETLRCGEAFGVPGVLLTAWVREDGSYRARARGSGCAAFVAKPCTPDTLASIARAVIAGARGVSITTARDLQMWGS